jgi:hypothetical protein
MPLAAYHGSQPHMPSHHPVAHRSHDYRYLMQRWKLVAKKAGLTTRLFHRAKEWPVYILVSAPARKAKDIPCIYLSTGVHGDEPAPLWGLLEWAEGSIDLLATQSILIYPCLNPYGLVHNLRRDEAGIDINRHFHNTDDPLISDWRQSLSGRTLRAAFHLHEDFDAQGIYLYELNETEQVFGHDILQACSDIIPVDQRRKIEGRKANAGLIVRRNIPTDLPGLPEALAVHQFGASVTMTFESPSEFGLFDRIRVHKKFISTALHDVCGL